MEVERAQVIASLSAKLGTIPAEFVRSELEQPGATTFRGPVVPEIPVIDLLGGDHLHLMVEASKEWGIFQVVNHGIPKEVVEELQSVSREFFELLPQEEKEAYARIPGSQSIEGYGGTKLNRDLHMKKTWVDFLFHYIWPPARVNYKFWPTNPPAYRKAHEEYAKHVVGLAEELLGCLSVGVGLERGALREAAGGDKLEYLLKNNYYPPCPQPDLALGLVAHTDMSAITLLLPDEVQGLQIFWDARWFDVHCIPNAVVVVLGDIIQTLSNGNYKAPLHRTTVNKEKTRMSWPVFCSPPREMVVGPLPLFVTDENPAKFKTKKYKDYVYCKTNRLPQ